MCGCSRLTHWTVPLIVSHTLYTYALVAKCNIFIKFFFFTNIYFCSHYSVSPCPATLIHCQLSFQLCACFFATHSVAAVMCLAASTNCCLSICSYTSAFSVCLCNDRSVLTCVARHLSLICWLCTAKTWLTNWLTLLDVTLLSANFCYFKFILSSIKSILFLLVCALRQYVSAVSFFLLSLSFNSACCCA